MKNGKSVNSKEDEKDGSSADGSVISSPSNGENKNVWLALVYTFLFYFSRSLWSANIFSSYIYLLEGSSSLEVGYITGVAGVIQVLVAPVVGYLADKSRRDKMLFFSGK